MDRWSSSGNLLFAASAVVEAIATFSIGAHSMSGSMIIAAVLLIIPSFVVGYFAGRLGIVYGLILGLMPALFATVLRLFAGHRDSRLVCRIRFDLWS